MPPTHVLSTPLFYLIVLHKDVNNYDSYHDSFVRYQLTFDVNYEDNIKKLCSFPNEKVYYWVHLEKGTGRVPLHHDPNKDLPL